MFSTQLPHSCPVSEALSSSPPPALSWEGQVPPHPLNPGQESMCLFEGVQTQQGSQAALPKPHRCRSVSVAVTVFCVPSPGRSPRLSQHAFCMTRKFIPLSSFLFASAKLSSGQPSPTTGCSSGAETWDAVASWHEDHLPLAQVAASEWVRGCSVRAPRAEGGMEPRKAAHLHSWQRKTRDSEAKSDVAFPGLRQNVFRLVSFLMK